MHKLDVAFCDTNEPYGERFAAYLMEHKAKEFTVHLFPEPELFLQKIKNEKFDLVLLGSGFSEFGEQAVLSGMTVLILSENIPERLSEDNSYLQSGRKLTVIFKYQPMEAILHEMMVVTGGKKAGKESFTDRLTKLEIIGVYSPIGHEMQMPFSMVLSSVLAKQRRILYINLMQNTGFLQLFDSQAEYDIGDLTLRLRRGTTESEQFFQSIYEMGDFSYVAPFRNPEQLGEFQMDDYRKLLAHLEENTKFDTVVFDFGTGIPSIAAFLEECSSIYCPVKEGYFYECQKTEFVHYLEQVKPDGMSERLQFVNLPFTAKGIRGGGNMLEQLVWSEFGDYIRDYLAGDAYGEI